MKREELLPQEETKKTAVDAVVAKDKKFIDRTIRTLNDEIEDADDKLKTRLMSNEPIDNSVVDVLYYAIMQKKELKNLYSQFKEEFLS